jgi:hypothetical protein
MGCHLPKKQPPTHEASAGVSTPAEDLEMFHEDEAVAVVVPPEPATLMVCLLVHAFSFAS